jgi:Protein SET DOMAIN GROUP 2 C-terminal
MSDKLRTIESKTVQIPALCDTLWLYANTNTYFTPNEKYKKTKGDE